MKLGIMHLFLSDLLVGKPLSVPQFCTGLEGAPPLGTAIFRIRWLRCFRGVCASRQAVLPTGRFFGRINQKDEMRSSLGRMRSSLKGG
jgi:hypothetical protein